MGFHIFCFYQSRFIHNILFFIYSKYTEMLMKRQGLFVKGSHRRNGRFLAWRELKQISSSRNLILLTSSGFIYRERKEVQRKSDQNLLSLYIGIFLLPSFSCKYFLRACDREFYREKWKSLKYLYWFNVIMFFLLLGTLNVWLWLRSELCFQVKFIQDWER